MEAVCEPRGVVNVNVFRLGSVAEKMQAEESVLLGDSAFYEQLAAERRTSAKEWTDYYAGQGRDQSRAAFLEPVGIARLCRSKG